MNIEQIIDEIKPKPDDFKKEDFIKYCDFMMGNETKQPDITVKDYYKQMYKVVEMINEEQMMAMIYQK
jgi:hypothetical protein